MINHKYSVSKKPYTLYMASGKKHKKDKLIGKFWSMNKIISYSNRFRCCLYVIDNRGLKVARKDKRGAWNYD